MISATASRPEGPTLSSHVREGVDRDAEKMKAPKVRHKLRRPVFPIGVTWADSFATNAGPSGLNGNHAVSFHALTDVAIECRPFGPETTKPL